MFVTCNSQHNYKLEPSKIIIYCNSISYLKKYAKSGVIFAENIELTALESSNEH